MASGLIVSLCKSCLLGINVSSEFMGMACKFLNCSGGGAVKVFGVAGGSGSFEVCHMGASTRATFSKTSIMGK